jgi:hypothetical protein
MPATYSTPSAGAAGARAPAAASSAVIVVLVCATSGAGFAVDAAVSRFWTSDSGRNSRLTVTAGLSASKEATADSMAARAGAVPGSRNQAVSVPLKVGVPFIS